MWKDTSGKTWFKGNLHTHTTRSDGRKSPEESIALYRSRGYDFLALTDHWKPAPTYTDDGMLILSGAEYDFGKDVRKGVFHIVGVGAYTDPQIVRTDSPQTAIDKIRACGGLAILAHPVWSMNTPEQIRSLDRFDATEIFNSLSDLPHNCRPYSGCIADLVAAEGRYLPLIATDDTHFYDEADTCRSYIMVQAEENTPAALFSAIRRGDFYATQGPHISVTRTERGIRVESSPVSAIVFFTDTVWVGRRAVVGEDVTEAQYDFAPGDTFVRVEATDADGKTAWSCYFTRL